MLVEFECPQCKGHICERWDWQHCNRLNRLAYLHFVVNPGIAVNELILGQRLPKQQFTCKSCPLPSIDRSYFYCPNCETFHASRIWSGKNAFGNWLGLLCPSCGESIPCLQNLTSRALVAVTAPLWSVLLKRYSAKWKSEQFRRIAQKRTAYMDPHSKVPKPVNYALGGLLCGLFMDLVFGVYTVLPLKSIHSLGLVGGYFAAILAGLAIWLPAGLGFGLIMKKFGDKKGDPSLHLAINKDGTLVPFDWSKQLGEKVLEHQPPPGIS